MLSSFGYFSTAHTDTALWVVVGPSPPVTTNNVTNLLEYTLETAFAKPVVFILN